MGALRVGSLALSLGLPDGAQDRAAAIRDRVERHFLPAVLDSLARGLDDAYGEAAVIRVRWLRLRLRIGPEVCDAGDLARQVGQDLAAHVRDMAEVVRSPVARPPDDAGVTVWPTKALWHAAALHAAMTGTEGPDDRIDALPDVVERLLADLPGTPALALAACAEAGNLPALLDALPATHLRAILARTGPSVSAPVRAHLLAALARAEAPRPTPPDAPGPQDPPDPQRHSPTATTAPSPQTRPTPAALPAPQVMPELAPTARLGEDGPLPSPRRDTDTPGGSDCRGSAMPDPAATGAAAASRSGPDLPGPAHADRPAPLRPEPARGRTNPEDQPDQWSTSWGGLVYLVTLALRLGLPEALWRIGVPEGAALAAMLTAISGTEDDPLPRALDPAFPTPSLDPLPDWARDELCTSLEAAARDLTGRSRSQAEAKRSVDAASQPDDTFDLAGWGALLLLRTFADLIDRPPDRAALQDVLAIAGSVEVGVEVIRVRLPPSAIDTDIRKAALDADPGHLSWLGRRLVISYGPADEDWTG